MPVILVTRVTSISRLYHRIPTVRQAALFIVQKSGIIVVYSQVVIKYTCLLLYACIAATDECMKLERWQL